MFNLSKDVKKYYDEFAHKHSFNNYVGNKSNGSVIKIFKNSMLLLFWVTKI